jgi:hypothetical protein
MIQICMSYQKARKLIVCQKYTLHVLSTQYKFRRYTYKIKGVISLRPGVIFDTIYFLLKKVFNILLSKPCCVVATLCYTFPENSELISEKLWPLDGVQQKKSIFCIF